MADDGYLARANVLATVVALAVLAAGLVLSRAIAVPAAIVLLGAEYVAILAFERDALDTRAPLVAGALLAVAELAYWSLELRAPVVDEPGTYLRRTGLLALLVVGVVGVGACVLALVEVVAAGGVAVDILGASAALGALALLALASRRTG
jgi:FtsH-binding integral membrane protein